MKKTNQPLPDWGPALQADRTGRYAPEAQEFLNNRDTQRISVTQVDMLNASFIGSNSDVGSNRNSYVIMNNNGLVY